MAHPRAHRAAPCAQPPDRILGTTRHTVIFRRLTLEERFNSVTHGLGAAAALAGFCILLWQSIWHGSPLHTVATSIYGATLVACYVGSTGYHLSIGFAVNRLFLVIDHCCVYLLIAGTYTPFMLLTLRGVLGFLMLGAIWLLAAVGIVYKLLVRQPSEPLSLALYALMGWLIVVSIGPFIRAIDARGLVYLLAGGLSYTTGIAFYAWKRLPFGHTIWHLFVLAGSALHYLAVLLHVGLA
jgi:hemolysin III